MRLPLHQSDFNFGLFQNFYPPVSVRVGPSKSDIANFRNLRVSRFNFMILSESLSTSRTVTAAGPSLARAGLLTLDRHTPPHTYNLQHIGMIISKYNSHLRFLFTLQSLFQHKNFMIKLIIFFPNFKWKLKRNFCSKSSQLMTFMESIHQ